MQSNPNHPQHVTTKGQDNGYLCTRIFVECSIFLWIVTATQAASTAPTTGTTLGYLAATTRNFAKGLAARTWTQSLTDSKIFNGLNITHRLNDETKNCMTTWPHFAARGKLNVNPTGRSKRYALQSKWSEKTNFTYRIHNFPRNLSEEIVEYEIARAFGVWSNVTHFTFIPSKNASADINISFLEGYHGHTSSFDGSGGALAHAGLPDNERELAVHFDAAEYWTSQSDSGINLFQVAVHEIGHTLGLGHSDVRAAVMWYGYKKYDPNYQLHEDDIEGIQKLYGTYDLMLMIITLIKDVVHIFF